MADLHSLEHAGANKSGMEQMVVIMPRVISVLGIDLGHGETMVVLNANGSVRILRHRFVDEKILTACALVLPPDGEPVVLIGNALLDWDEFRLCGGAHISKRLFRLLEYYVTVLRQERPGENKLYVPFDPQVLSEGDRAALLDALDDGRLAAEGWQLEKAVFTPVYQHFKAEPDQWKYVRDEVAGKKLDVRCLISLFLRALRRDLAYAYMRDETVQAALRGYLAIGVPASPAYASPENRKKYARLLAEAWQTDEEKITVHAEPYAALMRNNADMLQPNQLVFDSGSITLDTCCIGVKKSTVCRYTASTHKCGGHLIEKELLQRILRQENIKISQLMWGEVQSLQLRLRFIKETFCAVETDSPCRGIDIHLKDGQVKQATFNMAEMMQQITGPGSAWFRAAYEFFRDARTQLMLNGIKCESVFITGGNANVPGLIEAARRGLTAKQDEPVPEIHIAEDKSSAVAVGLCNIQPDWALAQLVEQAVDHLMGMHQVEMLCRTLRERIGDVYKAFLPLMIAQAAQQQMHMQQQCKRSELSEAAALLCAQHERLYAGIVRCFSALVMDSRGICRPILSSMKLMPMGPLDINEVQVCHRVAATLGSMEQELLQMHRKVAGDAVCGMDFRGVGVNTARRLFALPLAMVDVLAQSMKKEAPGFGLLEDSAEYDYTLSPASLQRISRRTHKDEVVESIAAALYHVPLAELFARRVYRTVLTWYVRRAMGMDADEVIM